MDYLDEDYLERLEDALIDMFPRKVIKDLGRPDGLTIGYFVRNLKPRGIVPVTLFDQYLWACLKSLEYDGLITKLDRIPTQWCFGLYRPVITIKKTEYGRTRFLPARVNAL